MSTDTNISWTDHTFNPWIGCSKVSPACDECYAEARDKRFSHGAHWGPHAPRQRTATSNWKLPAKWNREVHSGGACDKVFCGSLCDIADNHPSILQAWRDDLAEIVLNTPNLDWQFLTKRPQNLAKFYSHEILQRVWVGATVENQQEADRRIPILAQIPALIRWLSIEPLLERVQLNLTEIGWMIVGGESGRHRRVCEVEWIVDVVMQCTDAGVPCFVKQDSALGPGKQGRLSDAIWAVKEFPL
jgi:protein gp37